MASTTRQMPVADWLKTTIGQSDAFNPTLADPGSLGAKIGAAYRSSPYWTGTGEFFGDPVAFAQNYTGTADPTAAFQKLQAMGDLPGISGNTGGVFDPATGTLTQQDIKADGLGEWLKPIGIFAGLAAGAGALGGLAGGTDAAALEGAGNIDFATGLPASSFSNTLATSGIMPAAVAPTAEELTAQGLVQTGPGAWTAGGDTLAAGATGAAVGGAGAPGGAAPAPEASPFGAPPADAAALEGAGNIDFATGLPAASSFANTLSTIAEPALLGDAPAIGAPTASGFSGAGDAFGNVDLGYGVSGTELPSGLPGAEDAFDPKKAFDIGSSVNSAQKFLKDNWKTLLPAGIAGASALMPQKALPNVPDINALAASLAGQGGANTAGARSLMSSLETGTLPAAQQAGLDQSKEQIKTQIRAKYGQLNLSGSTMEQQELNNVDTQGLALQGQLEQQLFQSGLQEAGVAGTEQVNAANLYKELASMTLSQDEQLRNALANVAKSLALSSAVGGAKATP